MNKKTFGTRVFNSSMFPPSMTLVVFQFNLCTGKRKCIEVKKNNESSTWEDDMNCVSKTAYLGHRSASPRQGL